VRENQEVTALSIYLKVTLAPLKKGTVINHVNILHFHLYSLHCRLTNDNIGCPEILSGVSGGHIFLTINIHIKIGEKKLYIISPIEMTFTTFPWKQNRLLLVTPLLVAEC
jgi:hypothetical protein